MSETRRSARTNKGQHSWREKDEYEVEDGDIDPSLAQPATKKAKYETLSDDEYSQKEDSGKEDMDLSDEEGQKTGEKSQYQGQSDDDGEGEVRCTPCGANKTNYNEETDRLGMMIQCEGCDTWQHAKCMNLNAKNIPKNYKCNVCDPKGTKSGSKGQKPVPNGQANVSSGDKFRAGVAKALANVFKTQIPKDHKDPKGLTLEELAVKWSWALENAIFNAFPLKDKHYTDKSRAIMTLIKKPNVLTKLIDGVLTFDKLVMSSPEEIDEDLKQYAEKVRQESIRRSVLTAEDNSGQRIRRTHKGEEIVEDVSNDNKPEEMDVSIVSKSIDHRRFESETSTKSPSKSPIDPVQPSDSMPNPTTFSYNTAGLSDDEDDITKIGYDQSEESDLDNDDFDKIIGEQPKATETKPKPVVKSSVKSAVKSAMKSSLPPTESPSIWTGSLVFPDFASFPAACEFITCSNYKTPKTPLDVKFHNQCIAVSKQIFTKKSYEVEGRLDKAKAEPYLGQVVASRDFYLYSVTATDDHSDYDKLYGYLLQRNKVGVLSSKPHFAKDSYLISLDGKNIPGYLRQLSNLEGKSGLFALYVVKKDYSPGSSATPVYNSPRRASPPPSIPKKPAQLAPAQPAQPPILESILSKLSGDQAQTTTSNPNQTSQPNQYGSNSNQYGNNQYGSQYNSNQYRNGTGNGAGQGLTPEQMGILSGIVQQNPQAQNDPLALLSLLQQQQQQNQYNGY